MPAKPKDIPEINARIMAGEAKVLTAAEFGRGSADDADVVTLAFQAPLSGSSAMLVVPVAGRGVFTRAAKIWLNGIQGFPGPAPNERLGLVDTLVFADHASKADPAYDGTRLLADLMERKDIAVECISVEGDRYQSEFTIDQVQFARMYVYNAFLPVSSSYAPLGTVRAGSRVLLNRAQGTVIGYGTRSTAERQSISLTAEMFDMDPSVLAGDDGGLSNSVGMAVPVLDDTIRAGLIAWSREHSCDDGVAEQLKGLIQSKDFLLTDSDMEL